MTKSNQMPQSFTPASIDGRTNDDVVANFPTKQQIVKIDDIEKTKSRFYFFMATPPVTGGDLVSLSHIKALLEAGVDARILYLPNAEGVNRIAEFPPEVPVNYLNDSVVLNEADFVVVGESQRAVYLGLSKWMKNHQANTPKVIMFNQAIHWMAFAFYSPQEFNQYKIAAMIYNSSWIPNYMTNHLHMNVDEVFGSTHLIAPITQIPEKILALPDSQSRVKFKRRPKCRLAYQASERKRLTEMKYLIFAFKSMYPEYVDKVDWVEIRGLKHEKVLETLRSSDIYVASGYMDTHNLTAIEAMATGCHVLGYTGLKGNVDYFTSQNGWWFDQEGTIVNYCAYIKEAIDLYYSKDPEMQAKRQTLIDNGYKTAQSFLPNTELTNIVNVYQDIWMRYCGEYFSEEIVFACHEPVVRWSDED